MTDLDLTAIKKRIESASAGPWEAGGDGLVWAPRLGDPVSGSTEQEDAEFIAAARQDVPALVDRVQELEGALRSVLLNFPSSPADTVHSGPVPGTSVERWRSLVVRGGDRD